MPEVHVLTDAEHVNLWFSIPWQTPEEDAKWGPAREHPGGYVVEVGGSQWDTGFKTLTEAVNFAALKTKQDVVVFDLEYEQLEWEGRDDGDERRGT